VPLYGQIQVCDRAKKLTIMIYRCVRHFPPYERFGMGSQMTRAALSIGSNVAEGQRRATTKDFRNFVCIAEGSLAELQFALEVAKELEYVDEPEFSDIWEKSVELEKMLGAMRAGLDRRIREHRAELPS